MSNASLGELAYRPYRASFKTNKPAKWKKLSGSEKKAWQASAVRIEALVTDKMRGAHSRGVSGDPICLRCGEPVSDSPVEDFGIIRQYAYCGECGAAVIVSTEFKWVVE